MSRCLPLLLAAAAGLVAVPAVDAAPGPTRTGVDKGKQVGFTLQGRQLLVNLRPLADGQANPLVATLSGTKVVIACHGQSPKDGRLRTADADATWPAGSAQLQVHLSRDVSESPRWCLMEQPDGTDIAVTLKLRKPNPNATA